VPDSAAIHTGERERGVSAETGIESEVYNLLMLISAHSTTEASYGNGSVSLDASGYRRLCLQQRQREVHVVGMISEWVCEYNRARYIMVMFVVKSVLNLAPGNDLPAPLG